MAHSTIINKIESLFDSADELLDRGRRTSDRDLIVRSDRVFNIAQRMMKEHGFRRELIGDQMKVVG